MVKKISPFRHMKIIYENKTYKEIDLDIDDGDEDGIL